MLLSLLMATCTATFTACSSEESLSTAGNQLQLSFGINAPQSRAIFTDTKLPDASPVGVRLDGYADYANLVYTGTTTSGTQSWASTTSVTLTDTKGTLYAYWPQSNSVSIDAIDVDMTATDQTDWLYATPVTDVNEDKSSVAVTMNHALANINVKVNKGSYKGAGAISNITLQSDGIALGGTFNAAQTTPGYTAFEDEGKPLSRTVSTTAGGTATDIMVVPSGKSAAITFLLTIDGIQFTATSAAIQLAMGNSYQYTLNLSDISTYMEISGFSVKQWTTVTGGSLALDKVGGGLSLSWDNASSGVYAIAADYSPLNVADADESCIGVALIVNEAPVPQKLWIEKYEDYIAGCTSFYGHSNLSNPYYNTLDGIQDSYGIGGDFNYNVKEWTSGALSDFNGKVNSAGFVSAGVSRGLVYGIDEALTVFSKYFSKNYYRQDWYIPSLGQLALMYIYENEINAALTKIGGTVLSQVSYWSSTDFDGSQQWYVSFSGTNCIMGWTYRSLQGIKVRFVRDIVEGEGPLEVISFTISGQSFQAEKGMTWAEFCDSDMNLVNSIGEKYFSCSTTNVSFCTDAGMSFKIKFNESFVIPTDLIVADANYTYYTGGGGWQGQ